METLVLTFLHDDDRGDVWDSMKSSVTVYDNDNDNDSNPCVYERSRTAAAAAALRRRVMATYNVDMFICAHLGDVPYAYEDAMETLRRMQNPTGDTKCSINIEGSIMTLSVSPE
jgi:hypothetical protein